MQVEKRELEAENLQLSLRNRYLAWWERESECWRNKTRQREMQLDAERQGTAELMTVLARKNKECTGLKRELFFARDNSLLRDNVIASQDSYLSNLSRTYLRTRDNLMMKEAENRRLRLDEGGVLVRQLRDALLCGSCKNYVNTTPLTCLECRPCLHCVVVDELLFEVQQFLFSDAHL